MLNNTTLKSRLGGIKGQWKWHNSVDCVFTFCFNCIVSKIKRDGGRKLWLFVSSST